MALVYYQPSAVYEAVQILSTSEGVGKVLAGGTDLVLHMQEGKVNPDFIVDLSQIKELRFVAQENNLVRIGSMSTFTDVHTSKLIEEKVALLAEAASVVGSPQIRNQGTLGGNIANASPAADSVPALVALDAKVKIVGQAGFREANLSDILAGVGKNNLGVDEIITEIFFSLPANNTASAFVKLGRRKALAISRISAAVQVSLDEKREKIVDARIGLGSIAPNPFRAKSAEVALMGKGLSAEVIEAAVQAVYEEAAMTLGNRASAAYKKEAVCGVVRQALEQVQGKLSKGGREDV